MDQSPQRQEYVGGGLHPPSLLPSLPPPNLPQQQQQQRYATPAQPLSAPPRRQQQQQQQQPLAPPTALPAPAGVDSSNDTTGAAPASPTLQKNGNDSKRRRTTSGHSSRGVANLTPEQLAKKRANDREAQRAIRERTRAHVDDLERRIDELTHQKPYQELQEIQRQKDLIQAENEEIKRKLWSIQRIIQPLLGSSGPSDSSSVMGTPSGHLPPVFDPMDSRAAAGLSLPSSNTIMSSDSMSFKGSRSPSSTYVSSPRGARQTPPSSSTASFPSTAHGNFYPPASTGYHTRQTSTSSLLGSRPQQQPPDDNNKLALDYLMQSRHSGGEVHHHHHHHSHHGASGAPPSASTTGPAVLLLPMDSLAHNHNHNHDTDGTALLPDPRSNPGLAASALPVRNVPQTCPLDGLLLDFLADQRRQALDGVPLADLAGPPYPNFLALLHPHDKTIPSHPLSKVFTDMLLTFPDISRLPEQVAILYVMFLFMRYQVLPSPANYHRLPTWMAPRASQLLTPHPAWIEHLPWPRMRDRMVEIWHSLPFDEFFIPYTTTCSLNWPRGNQGVLDPQGNMTAEFERHAMDLANWSLGGAFLRAHPRLEGTCRIKD